MTLLLQIQGGHLTLSESGEKGAPDFSLLAQ